MIRDAIEAVWPFILIVALGFAPGVLLVYFIGRLDGKRAAVEAYILAEAQKILTTRAEEPGQ